MLTIVTLGVRPAYSGRPGMRPPGLAGKEDGLRGQVGVHALGAVRAALAAGAAPSPGRADVRLVQVDPERADPGPPGDVQAAPRVAGPHGGGEPESLVGEPQRFGLVPVPDDRRHRTA